MRIFIIAISAALSLYYLSCHENTREPDKSALGNMLFPDNLSETTENEIILANGTSTSEYLIDAYRNENVYIEGDSIHFKVSYSGGCKKHDFSLVAFSYFLESYPVQVNVLLAHDSHQDPCEALITRTNLSFNLIPLKEEYKRFYNGYGAGNGDKIKLNILSGDGVDIIKTIYQPL